MTVTHAHLVERAIRYLQSIRGQVIVLSEMAAARTIETPDAIGFSNSGSTLIECKVSRGDFSRDSRKAARRTGLGMGRKRFYMVPAGLVRAYEVDGWITGEAEPSSLRKAGSTGWGLLYYHPETGRISQQRVSSLFDVNMVAENRILTAALHRVQLRIAEPLHSFIRWETASLAAAKKVGL